jgi:Ring finger domain
MVSACRGWLCFDSPWRLLLLLALQIRVAEASLYVGSDVSQSCATYFGKFGRSIKDPDGVIVKAQYLEDNEYLCSDDFTSFRGHSWSSGERYAIVAREGNCTLRQKLFMTEALALQYPAISMLIMVSVTNLLPTDLDDLILQGTPMHCQSSNDMGCTFHTNLTVVSITKFCGGNLIKYIDQQSEYTAADGGPAVFVMDSAPPQSIEPSVLAVSIGLILLFSCSMAIVHVLFTPRESRPGDAPAGPVLLTEECVECFHCPNAAKELIENTVDDEPPVCAVCIECLERTDKVTVLPCGHHFHHHCIVVWLTERQASCPLCKYNLQPIKLDTQRRQLPVSERRQILRRGLDRLVERIRRRTGLQQATQDADVSTTPHGDDTTPYDVYGELEMSVDMS